MALEPLVLAVDDEPGIRKLIKLELSGQGFRVLTAENGAEAIRLEEEHRPDLVLLDVVMPDMTGLEVMAQLRDRTNVPIILLTGKNSDGDKVMGLESGADDYLAKPFAPDELSARVRAVLRRAVGTSGTEAIVAAGDLEIDLHRRVVRRSGEEVTLTRTEWMLLQQLAANPGRIMLNAELLTKVWGPQYRGDLQYLRVWMSRLRKKLENDPSNPTLLKTFTGIGYMLDNGAGAVAAVADDAASDGAVAEDAEPALAST